MNFPKNNYTTSNDEVEIILNDVIDQINRKKDMDKDVVAVIRSFNYYGRKPSTCGKESYYKKDAIYKAIPTIKANGWVCWSNGGDYEGSVSVWVTKSTNQPHPWFHRI